MKPETMTFQVAMARRGDATGPDRLSFFFASSGKAGLGCE